MFSNINTFFQDALKRKIIVSNDTEKTKKLIDSADKIWDKAMKENTNLKSKIKGNVIDSKSISELTITELDHLGKVQKRPIVDLVQQGGGMFGIALLGYTYIMEKAGIRFHSHGGTSAGAINASFLAAVPNSVYQEESIFANQKELRQSTKSEVLAHIIANTKFSSFMDREGIIGCLQEVLFKNYKSWKLWVSLATLSLLFLIAIYIAFSFLINPSNGLSNIEIRFYDFIVGTFNVFAFLLFCYFLIIRALGSNFGLNTGDVYYNWVDELMHLFDIGNTKELNKRLSENMVVRNKNGKQGKTNPRLVLISANLTHNKVVKLPEEAGEYWSNPENINPTAYLRATMSLPFIYKVLIPKMRHYDIIEKTNRVSKTAKFVDGGMLSNFPIREFHSTDCETPSFPTFGVLLGTREEDKEEKKQNSFLQFIGLFFKTFRNFYDNDFLIKNKETKLLVETVNTADYNWLNFWMEDKDKIGLFNQGAIAAIKQLDKFEWKQYKKERLKKN